MKKLKIWGTLGLLIMTLGFFVGLNSHLNDIRSDMGYGLRGPASQVVDVIRSASRTVERKLASQLASVGLRKTASVGRSPNPFENFRFGILEGKYQVAIDEGVIQEVAFIDNPGSESRPLFIRNRVDFLKENKRVLGLKEVKERVSVDLVGTKIVETYRVSTDQDGTDTLIKFTLDDMDRLLGIGKESVSGLKYF